MMTRTKYMLAACAGLVLSVGAILPASAQGASHYRRMVHHERMMMMSPRQRMMVHEHHRMYRQDRMFRRHMHRY